MKADTNRDDRMMPHHAAALAGFDSLPNSARVGTRVVAALLDVTPVTVWRRVRTGALPPPSESGPSGARWTVGTLRPVLKSGA